ncbi:hypothetical protein C0V73_05890 [Rhizobium sp. TH135]|uniref:T1SS-143 repeat domain-containing protein n=1 Tax=Rhizobium sp. TH135 TaxID=2067451 RepID=UPI000C7DF2CB|nr:DUF5801 repeats-in-toxin domain-containing protein [Rhizobium sp. TH135]PLK71645.1 hypothetical protein C0V73_05890 [Rhizobium sp. TH135]
MSIEDPRLSSIDNTSAADDFDSAVEQHLGYASETVGGIEVAQAEAPDATRTDRLPAQTPPVEVAAATIPTEVKPNEQNVVTLPAGIELDNLEFEVDGENLVLVLADGTEIVVLGGAANIPTFVIGDVELPQVALFAALEGSNINVAAGPDGTFSAQGTPSASRNFNDDPIDAGPEDLALADLLGDTSFGDELRTGVVLGAEGDTEPTFFGAAAGSVDEDYLEGGNINDGQTGGASSFTGSLGIDWGSDDDNVAGNTGLSNPFDRGVAFTQATLNALISEGYTSDGIELRYELSADGTTIIAYKLVAKGGEVEVSDEAPGDSAEQPLVFREDVFEVSVSDAANGSYTFTLKGNLDHPDGSTEDDITIEFPFTAQDSDGDQASSSFTVTVNDDSPVIDVPTDEDGEPVYGVVEEEQRDVAGNGNEDTTGEYDGDYYNRGSNEQRSFGDGPGKGRFVDETTNVARGSLGISWGADDGDLDDKADFGTVASLGNRSVSFVIPESEGEGDGVEAAARSVSPVLTSGGVPLVYEYSADGKTLTAYRSYGESVSAGDTENVSAKMLDNSPVFQVVLDDNGSGSYTFTLLRPLDHADGAGENSLKLDFQFTATDSDGDTTGPATISIIVVDDVPVLSGCDLVFTIDEDDIKTALSNGTSPNDTAFWDNSYTGDPNLGNDSGPAYIKGSLESLVKPGADGPVSFSFISGSEAVLALQALAGLGLSSHGDTLRYEINGNVLTAIAGEDARDVFSLTLNSNGSFEFELHDQLDHDAPGDDFRERPTNSDENFDLQDKIAGDVTNINFGALIKATDGDEDSISLDGAFSIKIRDDVPEVDARTGGKLLIVDETVGSDAGDDETSADAVVALFGRVALPGNDTDMTPQYATQQGMVTAVVNEGADDDATVTWALKLSNGNGTYSGLQTTDGRDIYLFIEGGLVVGRYDKPNDGDNDVRQPGQWDPDPAAFAIHIANDGTLSMVQYVSIKHDDQKDSDESNDASDGDRRTNEETLANKILAEVTVKDFDGDKATDTVEIGSRIVFQDDGPQIDIVAANDGDVVLTTQDGETIGINVKDTAVSSAAFGSVFSIASQSFGADGAGRASVSYALSVTNTASGLKSDGRDITLEMSQGKVVGKTSAGVVFSIEVDGSGKVTLTQFMEIDHGRSDTSGYETDLTSLADNLVKLTATATITDADGDKHVDSAWIDLGGNIKFADHGPTVATSASLVRVVVDEDGLLTAASDSAAAIANGTAVVGDGLASKPVTVASLMSLFNFGADGAHATEAISLKAATNEPTGLTSQSKPILISVSSDGKTLTGTADGREVFTLKLNAEGTSYTFELKDQIDHPTLNNVASGSDGAFNDAENLLSSGTPSSLLDLSQFIVGKDGDGDTVTLTAGKFVIDVRDDIPTVTSSVVEVKIDTPQIVAPVEAKVANFVLVLDTSGSVNVQQFQIQVKNFLENLAATGAKDVRVHIVEFSGDAESVGTYDLIRNGVKDQSALDDALSDIAGLSSGGSTNYEAGMREALDWIEGIPARVLEVDNRTDDFDASVGGSRDEAYILFNGSTQVAMVSGWTSSNELGDAEGSLTYGWGVDGENLSGSERLRFDFGAFNNYDGAGEYANLGNFDGVPVTSAQFKLEDKVWNGSTTFSYTVHFTDGTSPANGSQTVNGIGTLTITAPAGKQIAYIEFAANTGFGDVDLEKVTTAPDGPLANANVNELIFLSDGEPNENETNNSSSATEALEQIKNEIAKIESGANAPGDQAFTIQAYGIKPTGNNLTNLGKVEGDGGIAENLTPGNTLSGEYASTFAGLAGTPGSAAPTSANFNLSPLVSVGADEGLTFSMKSSTSGLPVLQSGGLTLVYTVANNILTATAGENGPTVFTLSLAANGSGTFTLNKPIDGQGDRDVDFSSMIQAQDFDGDAVSLAAGKFVVTVDGAPSGAPQTFETTEDKFVSGTIAAIIGDDGVGQNGFSISSGPANGSLLLNTKTGEFTYTPNKNWSGTETFSVTVTDDDGDVSAPIVVTVIVAAVADAPSLTVSSAIADEDTGIFLSVSSSLTDTDGSETLKLEISDIPVGAKLTGASGQTFTATAGSTTANITGWDLSKLKITPPANSDADFTLKVRATSTEAVGGDTEVVTKDLAVSVTAVADAPSLTVSSAIADEDTGIFLSVSSSLTDTDGSETLKLEISDIPAGAVLTDGTRTFTATGSSSVANITGWTLSQLKITPPANSDADFTLKVRATSTEAVGGDTEVVTKDLAVSVTAVADAPSLTVSPAIADEDTGIFLSVSSSLTDTDGSETLKLEISDIPAGAVLTDGTRTFTATGSSSVANITGWTLSQLKITPPANSDADFTLKVRATSTEANGGDTEVVTKDLAVSVTAVADAPSLTVSPAIADEDTGIFLSVSSSLTDTDGSETLKLEISDIPAGAVLTDGTRTFTATGSSSVANITGWTLSQLKITPPANSDADFTLKVHATSKETNGGDTEVVTKDLAVSVTAVADAPSLTVSSASGNEDTAISLSVSSSLTDTDGSETLKLEISDIPAGAVLTDGTRTFTATGSSSVANITGWTLSQLKITPPANSDDDFTLKVRATSKEINGGDTEVVSKDLAVSVAAVADSITIASKTTVDMNAYSKVIYTNANHNSENDTSATINNFDVSVHRIAITAGQPAVPVTGGNFVTASSLIDVTAAGSVIEIMTGTNASANDGHNASIEQRIFQTIDDIPQGFYTVIVYSSNTSNADAYLFTMKVDSTQSGYATLNTDEFSIEHVMTIKGVGYGNLKPENFVGVNDPIILDLDKNGFAFSSIDNGVTFDIDADGNADQIAWTSDDGILAYDVDGNGLIDNGSEIFTPDFNGGKFASGVAALASLDSNKDGKIDASDDAFSKLQVWVDADNDGISDEGELSSLSANGVASISLTTDQTGGEEDGQTVFAEGEFTFADGSTGNFLEVGFDTIFGSENDGLTLHGGMGEVVMTGSAGADTFVFDGTALDELDVADVITDFSTEEGDVLDVTALLDSLLGEQPDATVETHLRATVDEGNTTVSVQTGQDTWKDVVVLQNHDTAIKVLFDDKHAVVTPHD